MTSVYLLTPETHEAEDWVDERIPEPIWFNGAIAVEHRYIEAILWGIELDGLEDHFSVYPSL